MYSFALQALSIIIISIIFSKIASFSYTNIQIGVAIGSFLCVWPAIYVYDLLFFIKSKSKAQYFCGCLLSWVFSVLLVRFSCHIIIPALFENKGFFLVDNTGITIILFILSIMAPFGSILFLRKLDNNPYFSADTFQYDLYITYQKMDFSSTRIIDYSNEIEQAAKHNHIPYEILHDALLLEYINRGTWYFRLIEKLVCSILPPLAIRLDVSVGIAQLKISTAKKLTNINSRSVIKQLLDPCKSIELCASYIRSLMNDFAEQCPTDNINYEMDFNPCSLNDRACFYLASEYLCGKSIALKKYVLIYATILINTRALLISTDHIEG
jgi:hypothetical protein